MSSSKRHINEIDGLRMLAVLAVVLFHLRVPYFNGGYVGVDIFFVISGYLITKKIIHDLQNDVFSFPLFWAARIRRIFPALIVTITITFIVSALVMSPVALIETANETRYAALQVSNIYFWKSSGYFDVSAHTKPLLHTWSLGVEEQFYLIWPILLFSFFYFFPKKLTLFIILVLIIGLAVSQYFTHSNSTMAFFLMPFRIFQFAIGALIAALPNAPIRSKGIIKCILFTGLLMMGMSIITFTEQTSFPGVNALLPSAGAALCILVAGQSSLGSALLGNRVALFFGAISYSLYLVHWPIIVLYEYITSRQMQAVEIVFSLTAMISLAFLLYSYVEQPFRKKSEKQFIVRTRPLVVTSISLCLAWVAVAYSVKSSNGWTWRLNETKVQIAKISSKEFHHSNYGGIGCTTPKCETNPNVKTKSVFVLGDSHARALYAGLKSEFPDVNFIIFAPDACPMFSYEYTSYNDKFAEACQKARNIAFAEIKLVQQPLVILHQHWFTRVRSRLHNNEGKVITFNERGVLNYEKSTQFINAEINKLTESLNLHKLLVIKGIPKYEAMISPIDCLTRPLSLFACDKTSIKSEVLQQHYQMNKFINSENITYIDPYDTLCEDSFCNNTIKNTPLYSDTTHLSSGGSQIFIRGIKDKIYAFITK